jgi:uncharacterized NAD(P)/FAD-binding protein YdhS
MLDTQALSVGPAGEPRRIAIVGGGFTGVCAAVNVVRATPVPLAITLIEPDETPGRGLAYATPDPDHRLNGPTHTHSVLPADAWHLARWCHDQAIARDDPESVRPDGMMFIRRADYARYLGASLAQHADWPATGSRIVHRRAHATGLARDGEGWRVALSEGAAVHADAVFVATGNARPRLQPPLDALARHRAVIADPFDGARLRAIDRDAGLTALDVLSTLVRAAHRGPITVVSRHGLRPRGQAPTPAALPPAADLAALEALPGDTILARILAAPPAFLASEAVQPEVRAWLRALRARIRSAIAEGGTWHGPFDELRDTLWQTWPRLPAREQRRFLRSLRTWYDVHRFRTPPQNDALVQAAVAQGRIRFRAARLVSVADSAAGSAPASAADPAFSAAGAPLVVALRERNAPAPVHEPCDAIVNCTGLDARGPLRANAFLAMLAEQGWLRADACGLGVAVDAQCRAIGADGRGEPTLRVFGPPTAGTFGDPIGAMFIAAQIARALPDVLATLRPSAACSP